MSEEKTKAAVSRITRARLSLSVTHLDMPAFHAHTHTHARKNIKHTTSTHTHVSFLADGPLPPSKNKVHTPTPSTSGRPIREPPSIHNKIKPWHVIVMIQWHTRSSMRDTSRRAAGDWRYRSKVNAVSKSKTSINC